MLRTVFAFLLGVVVMGGAVTGLQTVGHAIWPPTPIDTLPLAAKVWVLVGYAIAVELAVIVAVRVQRVRWRGLAMALGLLMTALCAINFWMLPHPWWMVIVGLLVPLPIAMTAGWWMRPQAT